MADTESFMPAGTVNAPRVSDAARARARLLAADYALTHPPGDAEDVATELLRCMGLLPDPYAKPARGSS